uniref:Uncharacterized protein n=1 Tax=Craspedostauros australis TaxID=1486917 RepID=A0A7R9WTB8_9STRA|mmetsp:Transcript_17465/g.48446  ORF Transcript_17465/g.48446 Transcript_17465/m.48446 type:complete len:306 (+) Transcript_17465:1-918(+)
MGRCRCPGLMEENRFCRCWGTIGFMTKKSLRYNVLLVGLIANFIGMVLTIYACFAISEDFDSLQRTSFSSGDITGGPDSSASLKVDIGLKAIAFDESRSGIKTVVGFDELCDFSFNDEFDVREFTMTDACDECNDVSSGLVATVIMSAVTFIPSLATDILRMYENYDVNCQKGFATILAIISIVSSLSTLLSYKNACFDGFFDGEIIFSVSGGSVVQNDGQGTFVVDFDWSAGNGMIALAIGTALKVIDVVCNFLVATPTITRDVYEKAEYEKLGAGGDNTGGADADNEEVANDSDASRGDELNA